MNNRDSESNNPVGGRALESVRCDSVKAMTLLTCVTWVAVPQTCLQEHHLYTGLKGAMPPLPEAGVDSGRTWCKDSF